jgi:hypothetical protein
MIVYLELKSDQSFRSVFVYGLLLILRRALSQWERENEKFRAHRCANDVCVCVGLLSAVNVHFMVGSPTLLKGARLCEHLNAVYVAP